MLPAETHLSLYRIQMSHKIGDGFESFIRKKTYKSKRNKSYFLDVYNQFLFSPLPHPTWINVFYSFGHKTCPSYYKNECQKPIPNLKKIKKDLLNTEVQPRELYSNIYSYLSYYIYID